MTLSVSALHPQTRWARLGSAVALTLAWILQRVPFSTHFCMVLLAALGPIFAPRLISFAVVAVHVIFVGCQARSAYGVWKCWRGTLAHSRRDWRQFFNDEHAKMLRSGAADHVIDIDDVLHAIIVPAYKEDVATLREVLDVLASHPIAAQSYHVCLGMEEREAGASAKANSLLSSYRAQRAFASICFSLHPGSVLGESAGKASNVNWAGRHMARRLPAAAHNRTVMTVMDADTLFASDFMLAISAKYALAKPAQRARTYYVPPTLFDRNSDEVPVTTRVTDIFWSCAGIGQIYPSSSFKAPTSAYAVSLDLVKFCDFWEGGPQGIGEDLHFAVKATFDTRGAVIAETVYSPASQTNVVGAPASGYVRSYFNDAKARWSQAVRHLWGSLDFGYSWTRALTGQFGPGQRKTGYVALNTEDDDADVDDDATTVGSNDREDASPITLPTYPIRHQSLTVDVEDPQRFPSPSTTATTDTTIVEGLENFVLSRPGKKGFSDEDRSESSGEDFTLPAPKYGARGDNDDDADVEKGTLLDDNGSIEVHDHPKIIAFVALFFRLFEAHIMIASMFLMMAILTFYPTALLRNGHMVFNEPYGRQCTFKECIVSIFESPYAASAPIPRDEAPGLQASWLIPTIVLCSIKAARLLGAAGIISTIFMCGLHDYYHKAASETRWRESDAVLRAWREAGSVGRMPSRYLGIRSAQVCQRRWPRAILDFLAIPAGLMYGVAPMLYAQLCHLHTDRLTYTVSAKSKTVVLATPFNAEAEIRLSVDGNGGARRSLDVGRGRMSVEIGRRSIDERGMDRFYRPERNLGHAKQDSRAPLLSRQI